MIEWPIRTKFSDVPRTALQILPVVRFQSLTVEPWRLRAVAGGDGENATAETVFGPVELASATLTV
jgi:hypothetical protein